MRKRSLSWVIVGMLFAGPAVADEGLTLVEDGQARIVVVVPRNASKLIEEGVDELVGYVQRISGTTLPRVTDDADPQGNRILIGQTRYTSISRPEHPQAHRVHVEGRTITLLGGSERGTRNAVYALLEEQLGCRWYLPGPLGEVVPRRRTLTVRPMDRTYKPEFESAWGFFWRHPYPREYEQWEKRRRVEGFPTLSAGHNWTTLVPPAEREHHPEWFALQGEQRLAEFLCTTHPEVIERSIQVVRKHFEDHPQSQSFSLSTSDGDSLCQCRRCRELDTRLGVDPFAPGGQFTDRILVFFNQIAQQIAKSHPDKCLPFLAYVNYTEPPHKVKPHPMLIPFVCHTPWEYCHAHPMDDPGCSINARFARVLAGWTSLCKWVYVYDYYGHWTWYGPWPLVHSIARDMPYMKRIGVAGILIEGQPNCWMQGLNSYVASKLFWDMDTDVAGLIDEYYKLFYAEAHGPMRGYHEALEREMSQVRHPAGTKETGWDWGRIYTRTLVNRCGEYLEEAMRLAGDGTAKERVERVRAGFTIFKLERETARRREQGDLIGAALRAGELCGYAEGVYKNSQFRDVISFDLAMPAMRGLRDDLKANLEVPRAAGLGSTTDLQRLSDLAERGYMAEAARELGFISRWWVVGPFDAKKGWQQEHGPEQEPFRADAAYSGAGGPVRWSPHAPANAFGLVNFREMFNPADWVIAYAFTRIRSERQREAQLRVGSDDGVVVWLNGKQVWLRPGEPGRGFRADSDVVNIDLPAGQSDLLVKVTQKVGRWEFAVRLTDRQGRPLKGVDVLEVAR